MAHQTAWICCQLGAREHYAIPRALHQTNNLALFITDAWVKPRSLLNSVPNPLLKSLQERFHPDLAEALVQDFTTSLIQFELTQRFRKTSDWDRMIARNQWFQSQAVRHLKRVTSLLVSSNSRPVLFTYSYAALDLLRYAKSQGWYTVLGQIDPGPVEEQIVIAEHQKYPELAPAWQPVPSYYWENWRAECELADRILVNSTWSKQALEQARIAANKIEIVPLTYTSPASAHTFQRTYPSHFSAQRPLRVLFLGLVVLRKGIAALLEAAALLQDEPIEFWMVGSMGIDRSKAMLPNIRWIGAVPRSQVAQYYQQADVFLFPTLSDGFGLTQLEAQAWKLPLIVSRFCGEVVKDGINGLVLSEVSGKAIATALKKILTESELLIHLSKSSGYPFQFSMHLSEQLQTISIELISESKSLNL
jgi:glycosyltransferase involved in cell wall biosynthesis